jgi:murein DD-endopeptidase MepM/ murein hydrolase activator NlpD
VRWAGEDVTACIQGGERSTPVWKACFFPIDLDAKPGPVELVRERAGQLERRTVEVGDYPYATQHVTIKDQGKVDPSPTDLARIEREQAKMGGLFVGRTERRFSLPLGPPLATLPTGGRFGDRRIFNGQPRSPHTGADYAVPTGTPVLAVADGTVVLAEEHFFPGKAVVVDHGDGLFTMSFHLDQIAVAAGQEVRRGDRLGTVGATGRVSGPHLHFAIRWRGARIDPELLLGRESATNLE